MTDTIQNLTIETTDDGCIFLEQEYGGNTHCVNLHPTQLRYLAEKAGLVASSDPLALRIIATLKRRMLVLRDRIDHLGDYMTHVSDHAHANLDYEMDYITATASIANEFCFDLVDTPAALGAEPPTPTTGTPAPATRQPGQTAATDPAAQPSLI